MRERILVTGPGGRVGTLILDLLREHYALRLFEVEPLALRAVSQADSPRGARLSTSEADEIIVGDIQDFAALRRACEGVHAVLHLAAISDEADFHSKLLPVN